MSSQDYLNRLKEYLQGYRITVPDENLSKVLNHTELVLEKNKSINLTAIKDMDRALILHALDSLLFIKDSTFSEALRSDKTKVLDLGTGGGYPGLPIACCSLSQITLLDSVGKKINACQEFVDQLRLSQRVICSHGRFEDYALTHKREFDFVVSRAVASLDVLIEYAEPFVKQEGYLIFSKGNPSEDELNRAQYVAKICGFENVSRETFELPEDFGHREVYIYKKIRPSKVKLPRRNGEARNKPLADK